MTRRLLHSPKGLFDLIFLWVFVYLYFCLRQNCTIPPDHWDFGMELGWRLPIGIHPKFMPSQTPTNHPYSFLNHLVNSVPKRKKGLRSFGKLNCERKLLLKYWNSIRTLEAYQKVKVSVHIWTTPIWTYPIWTNPTLINKMGVVQNFITQMGIN